MIPNSGGPLLRETVSTHVIPGSTLFTDDYGGYLDFTEPTDCVITRIPGVYALKPLEVNTELHRVYVRKTGPNFQLQMKGQVRAEPFLSKSTRLSEWIKQSVSFTVRLLWEFSEPPSEIFDLQPGLMKPRSDWPPKSPPPARGR